MYGHFEDDVSHYMILELCERGELFTYLRKEQKFNEYRAKLYAAEIICAIDALHQKNIIYRDLKPENILLDADGHVKLIDFGFAKKIKNILTDRSYTNCGTPGYCAPEVMLANVGHNYKADMWSIGIIMCEMIGGFTPFERSGEA